MQVKSQASSMFCESKFKSHFSCLNHHFHHSFKVAKLSQARRCAPHDDATLTIRQVAQAIATPGKSPET